MKCEGVWWRVRSKNMFPETMIHEICETNSSFRAKQRTMGKVQF